MNIERLIVGPVATNCWIYPLDEKAAAVIDPGDEAPEIISTLKKLNLIPKYILLTHGHFDHIAAVADLVKSFGEVETAIHSEDSQYLGADAYQAHSSSAKAAMGNASFLDAFFPAAKEGLPCANNLLEEGKTIGPFTTMHLPGHTPGSAAFWDKDKNIIFTGDTLFANGYGRTDLPGGNEEQLFESLKRLFAMDADIKVYPGHGSTTTIGKEAKNY
jgi:glyoxylase-like metal-dependent hydrolase (beta-lactamase superfamily II)